MTYLKTKESTLEALKNASRRSLTHDEVEKQRISFIMGSLNKESSVTRAKVKEVLAEQDGRKKK